VLPAVLAAAHAGYRQVVVPPANADEAALVAGIDVLPVGTLAGLVEQLDPARFARIHRSTVVNLERVREIQPWFRGDFVVVLRDGTTLGGAEVLDPAPPRRVDPARFELKVVNASASDGRPHTVRAWARGSGASVATNAGMFQTDGLTSVGLMRTRLHENNPRRSGRYKASLALDPLRPALPSVRILDATCGEMDSLSPLYGTIVQSIRMVSCDGKNVWAPDLRRWSAAALGVDGAGRALFVHARSPWPVHDLVEALLALGEGDEALAVTARLRALADDQDHPWGRATATRCEALVRLAAGETVDDAAAAVDGRPLEAYQDFVVLAPYQHLWLHAPLSGRSSRSPA
jgi:hypothetical protein